MNGYIDEVFAPVGVVAAPKRKRRRPPKPKVPKNQAHICVYLPTGEREFFERAAADQGISLSKFMREAGKAFATFVFKGKGKDV